MMGCWMPNSSVILVFMAGPQEISLMIVDLAGGGAFLGVLCGQRKVFLICTQDVPDDDVVRQKFKQTAKG